MLVESIDVFFLYIEDCKFVENSVRNEGLVIYVIVVIFDLGLVVIWNVLFMRNVLYNLEFIEDFFRGGILVLYVV